MIDSSDRNTLNYFKGSLKYCQRKRNRILGTIALCTHKKSRKFPSFDVSSSMYVYGSTFIFPAKAVMLFKVGCMYTSEG